MSFLATSPATGSELEQARPQTSGEEQLQIQLALAMSREAAEQVGAQTSRLYESEWLFKDGFGAALSTK